MQASLWLSPSLCHIELHHAVSSKATQGVHPPLLLERVDKRGHVIIVPQTLYWLAIYFNVPVAI